MDQLPQILVCDEGALVYVPDIEECSVPIEEWPRPLQLLLGLVEGPWKEPERNEHGQPVFAQKMRVSSHQMAAIFAFLRTRTLPGTVERVCITEQAFVLFGGCNVFDEALMAWREQPEDGPYNPRSPGEDVHDLYDWDTGTPYMFKDKLDNWELVNMCSSDMRGAPSQYGIWRSLKSNVDDE